MLRHSRKKKKKKKNNNLHLLKPYKENGLYQKGIVLSYQIKRKRLHESTTDKFKRVLTDIAIIHPVHNTVTLFKLIIEVKLLMRQEVTGNRILHQA